MAQSIRDIPLKYVLKGLLILTVLVGGVTITNHLVEILKNFPLGPGLSPSPSATPLPPATPQVRVLKGTDINIRSGPGLTYNVIEVGQKGYRVELIGQLQSDSEGYEWYKVLVRNSGTEGWVRGDLLAVF